jgi:HUS1 checkpoint protein
MRFKAKLAPEQVSLFHSIIVPMTRLNGASGGSSNTHNNNSSSDNNYNNSHSSQRHYSAGTSSFTRNGTVLYFDTDHVRISSKSGGGGGNSTTSVDGITCFVELNAQGYSSIFLDRRIESVAPNNAIVMEIDLIQLRLALKSVLGNESMNSTSSMALLEAQRYVVIKLAKRQNIPCLCIDACRIGGSTKNSNGNHNSTCTIQVHHAIPVRILRHTEMSHHLPPPLQQLPNVQLELTQSSYNLRTVIDRLKSISSTVYLDANMKGELTISAHTDGASIQTYLSKLIPRFEDCVSEAQSTTNDNSNNGSTNKVRMKVDTKKFAASLQWQGQPHIVSSALLCFVENEMIVVHVNLNPINVGFFTYYVPVHYLSKDPYDD